MDKRKEEFDLKWDIMKASVSMSPIFQTLEATVPKEAIKGIVEAMKASFSAGLLYAAKGESAFPLAPTGNIYDN